jgi:hypothetical protein
MQYQPGIHPAINKRLADLALELAVNAPEVIEVLGHQPDSRCNSKRVKGIW